MFRFTRITLFIIAGLLFFSCKQSSIVILNKEVTYELPGRKEGTKAAHYKIQLISKFNSIDWSIQKIMLDGAELRYDIYDNAGKKQDAFNSNDTLIIRFSRLSNSIQRDELSSSTIKLYYFKKNKLKDTNISNFTLKQTPINQ